MKKIFALLLTVALLMNGVFALDFPDLKGFDWAKPSIERMSSLGIVTGYSDGSFRPGGNLTKYQLLVVLYRTLESQKLTNATEVATLKTKYAEILAKNNVPKWPGLHEAASLFLERGVIKSSELATYIVDGKQAEINREEVAIYVGKAINFYLKEDLSQLISVNLKDVTKISFEGLKYINILSKHGIISGDSQGFYNPTGILNRAQLSKIMAISIDTLTKANAPKEKTVEATVVAKLDDTKRVIFFEKSSTTASYTEVIDSTVAVTINGKTAGYQDLFVNLPVTLTYLGGKLTKVSGQGTIIAPKLFTGVVSSVVVFQGKSFLYYVDDESKKTVSYELATNATITSKGVAKPFTDMVKDDKVSITVTGDKVTAVDFQVRVGQIKGVVKAVTVNATPKLIVTVGASDQTVAIGETVKITRNGQAKTLSALLAGDQVVIDTIFDGVTQVTATGIAVKEVGVISEIKFGSKTELIIKGVDGKLTTYIVGADAKITLDGVVKPVFDLRPNYTIEFKADSAVITELSATSKVVKDNVVGVVQTVFADLKVVVVNVNGQSTNITQTANTRFLTQTGTAFDFRNLKLGQTIFVYGLKQDNSIQADLILLLE